MSVDILDDVLLCFADHRVLDHVDDPFHIDLSTAARLERSLFTACDETAGVDRLTEVEPGRWGHHLHTSLAAIFELPAGPDGEMDIEGLDVDDGWLWITGSHSLKRDKPELDDHDPEDALARMADIDRDPNRYFLGRVPLKAEGHGLFLPVAEDGDRRAACVKLAEDESRLLRWLSKDERLAPFLSLPSKENGFDIEGIAAVGSRVWLGLRGPVLRGHAVIVELDFKVVGSGHLKARRIDGDRRFRLHVVDSGGLGIRDLHPQGHDLLLLLGPTLASDGPARLVRWKEALTTQTSGVRGADVLEPVGALPYRGSHDHPEGICPWPEHGPDAILVIYDAPSPERVDHQENSVLADVVQVGASDQRDCGD